MVWSVNWLNFTRKVLFPMSRMVSDGQPRGATRYLRRSRQIPGCRTLPKVWKIALCRAKIIVIYLRKFLSINILTNRCTGAPIEANVPNCELTVQFGRTISTNQNLNGRFGSSVRVRTEVLHRTSRPLETTLWQDSIRIISFHVACEDGPGLDLADRDYTTPQPEGHATYKYVVYWLVNLSLLRLP